MSKVIEVSIVTRMSESEFRNGFDSEDKGKNLAELSAILEEGIRDGGCEASVRCREYVVPAEESAECGA